MKALLRYLRGSRKELAKVTWPARQEAWRLTSAVIIFTLIFTAFIIAVDYGLDRGFENIILGGASG